MVEERRRRRRRRRRRAKFLGPPQNRYDVASGKISQRDGWLISSTVR
jgi:hypothetical protein